ncbi:MAG: hypothetical protein ABI402_11610 [Ferruginibacter sp.]
MFNFYSCNYKKYKDTITNGKGTYWDVIKDGKRIFKTPSYSYFFGVTGECQYYSYRRSADGSIKRYLFDFGDMIYPKTWKLAEDTLQIQGFDYLLVSNKNKKLLLINLGRPTDSLELVESAIK